MATTEEAGFTKIPGEARFQLDMRSVQQASVDAMFAELHRLVRIDRGAPRGAFRTR